MVTICATGHRPDKLFGYNLHIPKYKSMIQLVEDTLIKENCNAVWTGMALGFDTIVAIAVLRLKKSGYNIDLNCAIPCQNSTAKWVNKEDIARFNDIIRMADHSIVVSDMPYQQYLLQVRNQYMVDHCDKVLALWDGSPGGTLNCINYAKKVKKPIIYLPFNKEE